MAKFLIPAVAGGCALALVGTVGIASALDKNDVAITVDGETKTVSVREDTVAEVLDFEGITVGEHDIVVPALDAEITDDMEITVLVARPLDVTVDGESQQVWTTATTVQEALGFLNLDNPDSKISASRSMAIGREGLSLDIMTPKDIQFTIAGEAKDVTVAGTVQDALDQENVTPDDDDIVTPAADTVLEDGMELTFIDVEIKTVDKDVEIPFEKKTVKSDQMDKGETKVTTEGAAGSKTETYVETYHNGELKSSEKTGEEVTKEPVTQVTTVGTREPARSAAAEDSGSGDSGSSGAGLNLAREAMWDRIAMCESTQNWSINTGNGYYGGLQFDLPTWRSVNGQDFAPYPHQASRAEQITVANRLYAIRGTQPWSCA